MGGGGGVILLFALDNEMSLSCACASSGRQ